MTYTVERPGVTYEVEPKENIRVMQRVMGGAS